jgi:glycosyltransferase involved in cell wall biosynthesis
MTARTSSLRVALICDWFHPRVGGIEIHLRGLAEGLAKAGHQPHIVTATPGPTDGYGFPVHRLDVPVATRYGFVHTLEPFQKIQSLLKSTEFDMIHCHSSLLSPLAYGAVYLAVRQGLPTLMTCHSVIKYYSPLFLFADLLSGWSRWPLTFSAVSPTAADGLKKVGRMSAVHILPNAIDAGRWLLPETPKDAGEIRLVSVMRLSSRKRAHALIGLLPELISRCARDVRLRLTIVGDGKQKPNLEKQVRRLGLQHVVELPGIMDQTAIARLFAASDIFVLPANQEAFGLAALEARAAGLPVVGMGCSGLRHFIRHGKDGLLAADDRELGDHLFSLITDPELRKRISRHNRQASGDWTWDAAVAQHLELYALAMQSRHIGRAVKP